MLWGSEIDCILFTFVCISSWLVVAQKGVAPLRRSVLQEATHSEMNDNSWRLPTWLERHNNTCLRRFKHTSLAHYHTKDFFFLFIYICKSRNGETHTNKQRKKIVALFIYNSPLLFSALLRKNWEKHKQRWWWKKK